MITMKPIQQALFAAIAAIGLAGAAHAQSSATTPPPEGRHTHAASQEQRQAKMADMMAKHEAKLHDALKLTPAQEPAWTTFVAAIKPADMAAMHGDRAAWQAMPAPQRMEKMIEMAKQHVTMMESHLAALKTFYAVLTPEQQKVFDAHASAMGEHMKARMMGH